MKKSKASYRRRCVVRFVTESETDYRWWRFQDIEPKEGFVVNTTTYTVPAYPRKTEVKKINVGRTVLSRTKLRKRLYGAGFRGDQLKSVFWDIVGFDVECSRLLANGDGDALLAMQGPRYPFGWTEKAMRDRLSARARKALTKGIRPTFFILDEFGYYADLGFANLMQQTALYSRKVGGGLETGEAVDTAAECGS